jgi:hypothetical protein
MACRMLSELGPLIRQAKLASEDLKMPWLRIIQGAGRCETARRAGTLKLSDDDADADSNLPCNIVYAVLSAMSTFPSENDDLVFEAISNALVRRVLFVTGAVAMSGCPPADRGEAVFIGRSNVGKSSLVNMVSLRPFNVLRASIRPNPLTATIVCFVLRRRRLQIGNRWHSQANVQGKLNNLISLLLTTNLAEKRKSDTETWSKEKRIPTRSISSTCQVLGLQKYLKNRETNGLDSWKSFFPSEKHFEWFFTWSMGDTARLTKMPPSWNKLEKVYRKTLHTWWYLPSLTKT